MAERYDDARLEAALLSLGAHLEYPPTPDLASAVIARLAARRSAWFTPSRACLVAAGLVLALLGVIALSPPARDTIARFFHVAGIGIQRVPAAPTPSPVADVDRLALGQRTSLDGAQRLAGFHVLVPARLGSPDAVYLYTEPGFHEVTLVYAPRAGLPESKVPGVGVLLSEFPGQLRTEYFGKVVGPGTTVDEVTVGRWAGYWLSGRPHLVVYGDPDGGSLSTRPLRLAGNTLAWSEGPLTLRLESGLTKQEAIEVGASAN